MHSSSKWKVMLRPLMALPALYVLDLHIAPHWLSRRLEDFGSRELSVAQGREELILEGLSIPEESRGLSFETPKTTDLAVRFEEARLINDSRASFRLFLKREPPIEFKNARYYSEPSSSEGVFPCRSSFSLAADVPPGERLGDLRVSQPERLSEDRFRLVQLQIPRNRSKVFLEASIGPNATAPGLSCKKNLRIGGDDWLFYPPLGHEMEVAAGSRINIRLEHLKDGASTDLWPALFGPIDVQALKIVGRQDTIVKSLSEKPTIVVESLQLDADRIRIMIGVKPGEKGVITGAQAPSLLEGFKRRSMFSGTVMLFLLILNGGGLLLLAVGLRSVWGVSSTVQIFVSYSRKDAEHMQEIKDFLQGLEKDVVGVKLWVDEEIPVGTRWDEVITKQLGRTDIALILVSQNYLDSLYCDKESQVLRKKARLLVPIILSFCDLESQRHKWITDLQLPHDRNETLDRDYQDPSLRKELFTKIRVILREAAEKILQQKKSGLPPPETGADRVSTDL